MLNERKCFTLIELLIVIAIIAILFSMLLPSLNKARRSAQTAVCSSNQAQLFKASMAYTTDNKFKIVLAGDAGYTLSYDDLIAPYMGRNLTESQLNMSRFDQAVAVLACPSSTMQTTNGGFTRSYSMNTGNNWETSNFTGITTETSGYSSYLSALSHTSDLLYSGERHNSESAVGYGRSSGMASMAANFLGLPVHPSLKSVYVFVDGHVESLLLAVAASKRHRQ